MVFIPRSRTLHESDAFRCLVIRRSQHLSLGRPVGGGLALHHHVGDDVGMLPEPEVVDLGGIVGFPTGGPDHGTDLQIQGFGLHLEIHRTVFTGIRTFLGVIRTDNLGRKDKTGGESHFERQISPLGFVQAKVEIADNFCIGSFGAISTAGALLIHVPGIDFQGDIIGSRISVDLLHLGQCKHLDPGIIFNPFEIDLQTTGRRAQFWKILIELCNPAA